MRRPTLFVIWLIVSLIQVALVRLTSDEGYYWFYSTHLQWGYYDHPPVIAAMIKAGYSLFNNEMGVRLMNVLMMSGSILLFFFLLPQRFQKTPIAFLLLLSQPLLNYFSIIVFPDTPLLFFSLLFLLGYKRWLDSTDVIAALLMGISMAGMLYSKYHGLLIVMFTVVSNFRLLRSKWFWIAGIIAIVLSLPHLWWQLQNGFPSFDYQLQKRTNNPISFHFVGEYISQQIFAFGPALLFGAFITKSENVFERSLKYIVWGTFIFFLFFSFKRFIHFHWTSIAIFPAVYLATKVFENKKKLCYWLTIPFLIIILIFRIHTVHSFLPFSPRDVGYYQHRDKWANEISALASDRPVVFVENFRESGLYSFYTGKMAVALFNNQERRTQYDLWNYEDRVQGKPVLIIERAQQPNCQELISAVGKKIYYRYSPSFQSYYNIPAKIIKTETKNDSTHLLISITNTRTTNLRFFPDSIYGSPKLFYIIVDRQNKMVKKDILKTLDSRDNINPGTKKEYDFIISTIDLKGTNWIEIGFEGGGLPFSVNAISKLK